ncbi:MAG: LLM class flavin-dependent oxidoreductase [Alphaproteobacteria bacterium]|nr:LLM class flavin-dependent oxidoreductase [Alphaproteobacteria bacterium]
MSIGVGLGLAEFPFSGAKAYWQWVELAETSGVDSIWQTDRLVSREPFLECMSVMAALAGATKKIKFGMNVASLGLRDPLVLAKQCATIDMLSGGRLLPAVGVGSPRGAEWKTTNRSDKGAGAIAEEAMAIVVRLWAEESVTFHGKHFHYDGASIRPRPVQNPLPFWIGGSSEAAIRRTAKFGTGWQAGQETPAEVAPVIARIKEKVREEGRSIDYDHYGIGFAYRFGNWDEACVAVRAKAHQARLGRDPKTAFAVGDAGAIVEHIRAYVEAGIAKFILRPIGRDDADLLDQTRLMIREIMPEIDAMNARAKTAAQ